jgi:hypothetical protein
LAEKEEKDGLEEMIQEENDDSQDDLLEQAEVVPIQR